MAIVNTDELISITEANRLGVSGLVKEVEGGHDRIVLRNSKPVAAVISMRRLERVQKLERLQADLMDISLVTARMMTDSGERHSLDDVLKHFGVTREELRRILE